MGFKTLKVDGFLPALLGMRLPLKSWSKADSHYINEEFVIGDNDYKLAKRLILAGPEHRKFLRQIQVWVEVEQPRFFFQEWDTYKIATVSNSESTMHKIFSEEFEFSDFDWPPFENCDKETELAFENYIKALRALVNVAKYETGENKRRYLQILKGMLPESFIQKRIVSLNYETLLNMYHQRKNHALPHWNTDFVSWIKTLPYSEFITCEFDA